MGQSFSKGIRTTQHSDLFQREGKLACALNISHVHHQMSVLQDPAKFEFFKQLRKLKIKLEIGMAPWVMLSHQMRLWHWKKIAG